jgi:hypothetical protein
MRPIVQHMTRVAKHMWRGFWQFLGAAGGGWLLTRIPLVREWAKHHFAGPVTPDKIDPTIFLIVLSMALLGLWISSEVRLFRLRQRVRKDMLTIGDLASCQDLIDALKRI